MAPSILILAEHEDGKLKDQNLELIRLAHDIADSADFAGGNDAIAAIVFGSGDDGVADALAAHGVGEVIYVDDETVANYSNDAWGRCLSTLIEELSPDVVLIANSPNGWDVAPVVAARAGVVVASGCSSIRREDDAWLCTRKAFNGKFVHEVKVRAKPLVATVDRGAAAAYEGTSEPKVTRRQAGLDADSVRSRFVELKRGESSDLDLTGANVIVAAGRGVGEADKLDVVQQLTRALGAQLGASRAVTDAGWLPHEHQIGSSGVTVSPKLYVAVGISGAIQHVVGMKSSGYIIAINKDPDAPIFGIANLGVVGDLFEIVPALTKAVADAKA